MAAWATQVLIDNADSHLTFWRFHSAPSAAARHYRLRRQDRPQTGRSASIRFISARLLRRARAKLLTCWRMACCPTLQPHDLFRRQRHTAVDALPLRKGSLDCPAVDGVPQQRNQRGSSIPSAAREVRRLVVTQLNELHEAAGLLVRWYGAGPHRHPEEALKPILSKVVHHRIQVDDRVGALPTQLPPLTGVRR